MVQAESKRESLRRKSLVELNEAGIVGIQWVRVGCHLKRRERCDQQQRARESCSFLRGSKTTEGFKHSTDLSPLRLQ